MITRYTVDLRQFDNGEADKISFPTFEQCLMYGIHKLKKACENGNCVFQAVIISDSFGRQIIVNPSSDELSHIPELDKDISTGIKLQLKRDPEEGGGRFLF